MKYTEKYNNGSNGQYTPPKTVEWTKKDKDGNRKQYGPYPALIPGYNPRELATRLKECCPELAIFPFSIGVDTNKDGKEIKAVSNLTDWRRKGTKQWIETYTGEVFGPKHTHIGIIPASAGFAVIDVDEGGEQCAKAILEALGHNYTAIPSRKAGRGHLFVPISDPPTESEGKGGKKWWAFGGRVN